MLMLMHSAIQHFLPAAAVHKACSRQMQGEVTDAKHEGQPGLGLVLAPGRSGQQGHRGGGGSGGGHGGGECRLGIKCIQVLTHRLSESPQQQ